MISRLFLWLENYGWSGRCRSELSGTVKFFPFLLETRSSLYLSIRPQCLVGQLKIRFVQSQRMVAIFYLTNTLWYLRNYLICIALSPKRIIVLVHSKKNIFPLRLKIQAKYPFQKCGITKHLECIRKICLINKQSDNKVSWSNLVEMFS